MGRLRCSTGKKAALTKLYRKNGDVNGVEPGKTAASTALNGRKAALGLLNWRNSGGNGDELGQ